MVNECNTHFPCIQRLRILIRDNRMDEAIQLGLDLYENRARAVVGENYIIHELNT